MNTLKLCLVLLTLWVSTAQAATYDRSVKLLTSTTAITNSTTSDQQFTGQTFVIGANTAVAGGDYTWDILGRQYNSAAVNPALTLKIYKNTVLAYTGSSRSNTGSSGSAGVTGWIFARISIRVLSTGVSGTLRVSVDQQHGNPGQTVNYNDASPTIISFDSTATTTLDLYGAWNGSTNNESVTLDSGVVEYTDTVQGAPGTTKYSCQLLTSTTQVTNSATSDQAFTGITWTVPAGTATVGALHEVYCLGHVWRIDGSAPVNTVKIYKGGSLVCSGVGTGGSGTALSAANAAAIYVVIYYKAVGASGRAIMTARLSHGGSVPLTVCTPNGSTVTSAGTGIAVDTTVDQVYDIRVAWSAASNTAHIVMDTALWQYLNP